MVRNVAARLLRARGYEVLEAEDGESALELAKALSDPPPQCIRVNTLKTTREDLQRVLDQEGVESSPAPLASMGLLIASHADLFELRSFKEGLFEAQDEASQFVQLTWLFTTQPELLQVGKSVSLPLALNRRVDLWTYDVVGQPTLYLPFGPVNTFHVKPRREAGNGVMTAEVWFAPSLQTLPVRILVRQDADSWIDLTLDKPPLQAER